MNQRITGRMSAEDFALVSEGAETRKRLVKSLFDGGARVLVGTDTPNPFVIPGFAVHEELQNFVEAGLTPYQAIKAATRDAAEFMNVSKEFGTIADGRRADLILIEGNPLESVKNIYPPAGVMAGGRWYPKSDLQKRLESLAASYAQKTELKNFKFNLSHHEKFTKTNRGLINFHSRLRRNRGAGRKLSNCQRNRSESVARRFALFGGGSSALAQKSFSHDDVRAV